MNASDKKQRLFLILGGFFLANALIAEFIGVKIFAVENSLRLPELEFDLFGQHFKGINMTAGVLLWPVVFIMTDLINEYFGRKGVRFFSFLTAGLIAYSFVMVSLAMETTPSGFWMTKQTETGPMNMDQAYNAVFGQGLWIIVGSLVAFLIGQIIDVAVFHALKRRTGEKNIWLRANGSTLVSQLIDSFVVLFIAFYIGKLGSADVWPMSLVLSVCLINYIYKVTMAVVLTPVLYLVHAWIDKYLGKDLSESMRNEAMGK